MVSATQGLILQSKIAVGADQTWTINNANTSGGASGFNNGEDLTFQGQLGTTTTATTAFSLGGKIVTTTGAGTGMISSGYAVANGTMNIGNSLFIIAGGISRFVTVGADVTLNVANGSTLHFQSNSAAVTSSAVMNLNGGTLKLVSNNATNLVTINGTVNVNNASTLLVGNTVGGGSVLVTTANTGLVVNANLAGSATLAALVSTSGTLNTSTISVSSGGTIAGRPQVAGVTTTVPALNLAAGSYFSIATGLLRNPTAAVLSATAFAPTTGAVLKVTGGAVSVGTFPGLSYSGSIGGDGFGALSLSLPFRVAGTLLNNVNSVDVQITALVKPTWAGTVNGNWDIDTSGNGSVGTANWAAASGPNTYVESVTLGNDSVIFTDTATTAAVNITTAVTPNGVSINNSTQNYSFTGTGRITGSTAILKAGTGNVTLANSGTNDFTGGTQISDGKLSLGDGATASVGTIGTGAVTVNSPGVFELNRPDAFTFTNALAGTGTLRKSQTNTATLSGVVSFGGTVDLAGGTLRFTGGGNLSGVASGAGALVVDGGTLQLSGTSANTFTSLTTINSGTLQLNKTGVNAIAGNLLFTGTGGITFSQTNQIVDSATITYDKAINGGNVLINETIGALTMLNGNDTNAQVQGLTGFVVTGLLTAQNTTVFAIASNNSGSVGGINMSGTSTVRIAGNSNPSTLTVGPLGITASGGTVQVGQGTGAFDAVLNLGGDVTTTGNFTFTDGGFTGAQLRQINLGASVRTFNIGTGTTTTIAPDIAGAGGGITKSGNGTLQLAATSASNYTGDTTVAAGTFLTTPAHTAGNVIVNAAGTFGVTQVAATTTMNAANLTTDAGATLTLATGAFGNPTVPVLNVSTFSPTTTTLRVTGSALAIGTNIPLIDYATLGTAFSNLTLALPLRTAGSLIDNTTDGRVDLTISGIDQVKWNGNVNSVWDIDPDTTGALGTANWKTTISNTSTRYFQGGVATDTANFDDTALGTTTVNLSTSLTPVATNVSNSTLTYTFGGTGKLTGATSLTKTGTGTLILANSTTYDHTGGTTISAGTLQIGDGTTNGVGFLPTGTVTNNATLTFNRPDDLTVSNIIGGTGNIVKNNANVVSLSAAATNATSYTERGQPTLQRRRHPQRRQCHLLSRRHTHQRPHRHRRAKRRRRHPATRGHQCKHQHRPHHRHSGPTPTQ